MVKNKKSFELACNINLLKNMLLKIKVEKCIIGTKQELSEQLVKIQISPQNLDPCLHKYVNKKNR